MKKLEVAKGIFTKVNDSTFRWTCQDRWILNRGYVYKSSSHRGERRLHRLIVNAQRGQEVDHIDGNPLNNLISNLRFVNNSQQGANRKMFKNNTSGFKGVVKHNSKWRAQLRINGKLKYFGFYKNPKEAAQAYN